MSVSSQIIDVLDDLCAKFGLVIDWTEENIIPKAEELMGKYISWEIAISWMYIVIAAVLVIAAIVMIIIKVKGDWISGGILCAVAALMLIVAIAVTVKQVQDILTCIYFPELQVFNYITGLLESGG